MSNGFFQRVMEVPPRLGTALRNKYVRHRPFRVHGMTLYHHGVHESANILRIASGSYERAMTEKFISLIKPGDYVVDVGAYIGYYSLLAAQRVGSSGHVWAFEPYPKTFALLKRNVAINNLRGRVSIVQLAASVDRQQSKFYLHWNPTRSSLVYRPGLEGAQVINVPTVALDDFFDEQKHTRVDVVKIDVEGAELDVLEGMRGLIGHNPTLKIFVEYNPVTMAAAGIETYDFIRRLYDSGFKGVYLLEKDMAVIEPTTRSAEDLQKWALSSNENTNLLCVKSM